MVDPDTKESRPISLLSIPASIAGHAAGDLPTGAGFRIFNAGATPTFHSTDPGSFYILWTTVGGNPALFRVACALSSTPAGLPWSYSVRGAVTGYTDPCVWTNLTKASESRGLQNQVSPVWDESKYGSLASGMELKGATNGRIVLSKGMTGQDLPCGVFIFDTAGTYERHLNLNTLNGAAGARFAGCHSPEAHSQLIGSTMTFSLQPGTTGIYKILPISNTYDAKRRQIDSWVGANVTGEKSSPTTGSHTLTDADVGRGCFAFRAGECRTDSAANVFRRDSKSRHRQDPMPRVTDHISFGLRTRFSFYSGT